MNLQNTKSRQYQLFKLLTNEDTYKPASYFKKLLAVSLKTVYNDLEVLNDMMKPYDISIHKVPRHGMKLCGKQANIETFQREMMVGEEEAHAMYTPAARRLWILQRILLEGKNPTLEEMEQTFYVTSASLRLDLAYLQELLKAADVSIYTEKGKIHIKGFESALQKVYKSLLLELNKSEPLDRTISTYTLDNYMKTIFPENILDISSHMLRYLSDITYMSISEYYTTSLYLTILILVTRIFRGHHMEDQSTVDDISYLQSYMIAYELAGDTEKKSGLHFSEADICYLSEQLFAHRVEDNNSFMVVNKEFQSVVDDMIAKMSKILEVDLEDDQKLRNSLLSHVPAMIYRMKRRIKISNPLLAEIKKQYIVLFSLTWYVSCDLEQRYQVVLDDDEISFLFIYFQVSLEKRHGIHFKNIVIVCPIGLAMSELVFTRVRQFLPNRDNIITMSAKEIYECDLSNIDFVISTMKLKDIDAPVIYVSPLMSDEDIDNITQFYSKLTKQHNTLQQIASTHSLEIARYMQDQFLFCNQRFKDKVQCLDFLIRQYEQAHIVTKDFARSVYDREEMGDTSVYTGVAMPHALPETVKETQISIVTLQEKIRWGVNDVKVIILIAIAEKDIDCIGEVLSRLLTIVESPEAIQELLAARNRKELSQSLQDILKVPDL